MFYIQRIRGLRRFPVEVNIKKKAIEGTRVSKIDKGPQIIKNKDGADRTTSAQSSSNNSLAEMQFSVFFKNGSWSLAFIRLCFHCKYLESNFLPLTPSSRHNIKTGGARGIRAHDWGNAMCTLDTQTRRLREIPPPPIESLLRGNLLANKKTFLGVGTKSLN